MSSLLVKAEVCFKSGRVEECAELLEEVLSKSTGFSRTQWRTNANILACKMKAALVHNDSDELLSLHRLYKSLWDKITGLPLCAATLLTEMTVTLSLCQLEHVLIPRGRLLDSTVLTCMDHHCQRLCKYCQVEWAGLSNSLPHIVKNLTGQRQLLLKMAYLVAILLLRTPSTLREGHTIMFTLHSILQESDSDEKKPLINKSDNDKESHDTMTCLALTLKDLLGADCGDLLYLKAWQLYSEGEYTKVLNMLRTATPTPTISLLRGHCLVHLSKPQSALCCYLNCVTSHSQAAILPAMTACCKLYQQATNVEAEMEARELCLEALRNSSGCVSEGVLWWKGEGLHDNPVYASQTEWAESAYITAMRAITHDKYEMASSVLKELILCGPLCPPLPPLSLIHLLLAKTLLLRGENHEAWDVCERLSDHLSILELEKCTPHSVLMLAQSFLLGALSMTASGDWDKVKCISHKSYQVCGFLTSRHSRDPEESWSDELQQAVLTLMELNLLLMAGVCLRGGDKDKSLALLAHAVSLTPNPSLLTSYNSSLLLTQRGKLMEAATCWLKRRGLLPSNKAEARHKIVERKTTMKPGGDMERFDVAMLKVWIRQC